MQREGAIVNLIILQRIADDVKDVPCVMVYTGVRKSEGNQDYYNVCNVTENRGEALPYLAMRLRKLNPQDLCSEVIVDSLSLFPDRMVFACWDLELVIVGPNKVPVVRYKTEDAQTKKIKCRRL